MIAHAESSRWCSVTKTLDQQDRETVDCGVFRRLAESACSGNQFRHTSQERFKAMLNAEPETGAKQIPIVTRLLVQEFVSNSFENSTVCSINAGCDGTFSPSTQGQEPMEICFRAEAERVRSSGSPLKVSRQMSGHPSRHQDNESSVDSPAIFILKILHCTGCLNAVSGCPNSLMSRHACQEMENLEYKAGLARTSSVRSSNHITALRHLPKQNHRKKCP